MNVTEWTEIQNEQKFTQHENTSVGYIGMHSSGDE